MKDLATADAVQQIIKTNSVMVEVDGSIKRIPLDKFMDSQNVGQSQLLRSIAWGTYLEVGSTTTQNQIGNLSMRDLYMSQGGRYMVKNDGSAAKLNPLNSNYYQDGTPVVFTVGHVMVRRPEFYYLVTTENGNAILWMSMVPIGGKREPERWIGAYKGYVETGALVSKPNKIPTGALTISDFQIAAQVNGLNWGLMNYPMQRGEVMRLLGKFANKSAQAAISPGLDGTGSGYDYCRNIVTGATNSLGDASGAVNVLDSQAIPVSVPKASFDGAEDLWGQIWEFRPGIVSNGATVYIYDANKVANDKPPVGVEYRNQTRLTSAGGSFIETMQLGEHFDIIPKTLGGGATSYWADGHWSAEGGELWLFGGLADVGSGCGLSAARAYNGFSIAFSGVGARLAYYGSPRIITGAALNA